MFLFFQSPNHIGQALPDGAKAIALRFYGFPPAFHSLSERYGYRIFFLSISAASFCFCSRSPVFLFFCVFTNIYFTQHLVRFLEQRFLLVQRAFIFHIFLFGFVEHGISCCFFAFLFVFFFNQTLATALTFGNSALGVLQKKPRCLLFPPHRHSVAVSRASVSCRCWCDWLCCKPRLPQILFLQVLRRYHTRQVAFSCTPFSGQEASTATPQRFLRFRYSFCETSSSVSFS